MNFLQQFFRACGLLTAGLFLAALAFTQYSYPIPRCTGQDIDAWLLPAALAPLGIPALIWSTVLVIRGLRRSLF